MLNVTFAPCHYIDGDGNIIIPKSVRPILDYNQTHLGDKKRGQKAISLW